MRTPRVGDRALLSPRARASKEGLELEDTHVEGVGAHPPRRGEAADSAPDDHDIGALTRRGLPLQCSVAKEMPYSV
jgi:hypothetical protein